MYQFSITLHKAQTFILIDTIPSLLHSLGPNQTPHSMGTGKKAVRERSWPLFQSVSKVKNALPRPI